MTSGGARCHAGALALMACAVATSARAADGPRPVPGANRWQEDWSVLADPARRTQPLDGLKYVPLAPALPAGWLSLGLTLRERAEVNDAAAYGTGGAPDDTWLIQRLQVHADLHVDAAWRAFVQLEDDRAFGKHDPSPVDRDPLDLRLAFVEHVSHPAGGTLKWRVGRQDFAFDLQRFVSSRDGPNVRQSFDALWADWETGDWRWIAFLSEPVQYRDGRPFDDHDGSNLRFHTVRVERHVLGGNELSAYWSLYARDAAHYGDASGRERRHVLDVRFAGKVAPWDWDLEGMAQVGDVGGKRIRAWATGASAGWTLDATMRPRLGVQLDASSGDRRPGDAVEGTFNPLFPNGYYFSLAGYTGDANLLQVKPSLTLHPDAATSLVGAVGFLWRETTADAVYLQPNVPIAGTAGAPGRRTATYWQLRADRRLDEHLTAALEAVHADAAPAVRRAGGHDSDYLGVELKFSW